MNSYMILIVTIFILVVVTPLFSQEVPIPSNKSGSIMEQQQDNIDSLVDISQDFKHTRKEIIYELGKPDSILIQMEPNRHVEGLDSVIWLHYSGLVFKIIRPYSMSRDLLMYVRMYGENKITTLPIRSGMSRVEVERVLGVGTEENNSRTIRYSRRNADWVGDLIWLHYNDDGKLVDIQWSYDN